jgi:hypothetical protein
LLRLQRRRRSGATAAPTAITSSSKGQAQKDPSSASHKAAVEKWIAAIKQEEALASVDHSVAEVDQWEQAHFREDAIRSKVKAAKTQYEDALREKFYDF